ncbi:uncharacterized protein LOC124903837 [Homo sapiens]|uniref:uncharacterized protein LOC124903837 n=1 Tax=Homo sapiens TaxID=9606 RepID=UPI0023E0462B|nr:uncharacterized protein LOC124903837 [Homo sapiens]
MHSISGSEGAPSSQPGSLASPAQTCGPSIPQSQGTGPAGGGFMFCFKQKTQPYFSLQKQKRKPKKIQPLNDACWLSVFVCLGSSGLPGRAGSLLRGLSSTFSFLFNGGFWSGGLGLGWPQCDQTVSLEGLRDLDRRLAAWLSLGRKDTPEFAAQRRVSRQEMLSSALQKSLSPPAIPDRPCPWLQGPRSGCEKDLVFLREGLELLHGSMLRRRGWGMAGVSQHKLWGHLSGDWDLHFCWLQFDTGVTGRPSGADMGTLKPQHNAEGALPRLCISEDQVLHPARDSGLSWSCGPYPEVESVERTSFHTPMIASPTSQPHPPSSHLPTKLSLKTLVSEFSRRVN